MDGILSRSRILLAWAVIAGMSLGTGRADAGQVISKQSLRLGEAAASAIERRWPGSVNDAYMIERVERVAQKLGQAAEQQGLSLALHAHVFHSAERLALGLPNGDLFVSDAFLKWTGADDGFLASAMAHELAHVVRQDLTYALRSRRRKGYVEGLVSFGTLMNEELYKKTYEQSGNAVLDILLLEGYPVKREAPADRLALKLLVWAGWTPGDYRGYLSRLADPKTLDTRTLAYLQCHPDSKNRAEALMKETGGH